ncbi:hypothetical protein [uncultured Shewanella sp.]|uniref:hypothetical protein n=1 Tax=uncultured Shewanella sp. TaxID=173975 RepID=UPI00261ADA55|nr:hypothetical protein [uncultured Shewanella sp.]
MQTLTFNEIEQVNGGLSAGYYLAGAAVGLVGGIYLGSLVGTYAVGVGVVNFIDGVGFGMIGGGIAGFAGGAAAVNAYDNYQAQ